MQGAFTLRQGGQKMKKKPFLHNNQCVKTKKVIGSYLLVMAILISIALSACSIDIRAGRRPDVQLLEMNLRLRESTSADVLHVLGEPFGKGKAMIPVLHSTPKVLWSYYYEEASMKDARRIFLFVFFDQDRYDGYMWFSSLPKDLPKTRK
jgi:hypothetical protein